MTMPRVGRPLAALSALAVLTVLAGCSGDSSDDAADTSSSSTAAEESSEAPSSSEESAADIPLSEEVTAEDAPAWGLPVVDGWSVPQELQSGVFQISKDGSEALVTAYQLSDPSASDAEQGGRAWLENYHSQVSDSEATDVSDPTYDTAGVGSTQGSMEFVVQELEYSTPDGSRYRSWSAARWVDGYLFALQYAAPEDEWSEDEWAQLNEQGLELAL